MPKRRTKLKNRLPPFVPIVWDILNSKAYIELPPSASKMLPYFLGKVQRIPYNDVGRYETTFSLTYSEAARLGFGRTTFSNIIKSLMLFGFIDPVKKGGLRSFGNTKNIFKLSKRWQQYGTAAFTAIKWECFYREKRSQVSFVKHTGLKRKEKVEKVH